MTPVKEISEIEAKAIVVVGAEAKTIDECKIITTLSLNQVRKLNINR